jgi:capsular exopolysaccharide synthesis family protein
MSLSESHPSPSPPSLWTDTVPAAYLGGAVVPPDVPPPPGGGLSLKALLKGLLRHWFLALGLGLLGAGAAAALAWKLMPAPLYTARALVRLSPAKVTILAPGTGGSNITEFRNFQKTQALLVKSHSVFKAVLSNPRIASLRTIREAQPDPITWLDQSIRTEFEGEIMKVSLSGTRPRDLRDIVNAVVDHYINNVADRERLIRRDEYEKIDKFYATLLQQIKDRREAMRALSRNIGSSNRDTIELQHQLAIERHNDANRQLAWVQLELQKAEAELRVLRSRPAASPVDPAALRQAVEARLAADPKAQQLQAQIDTLEDKIQSARRLIRNHQNDPLVRTTMAQLADLRAELAGHLADLRPQIEAELQGGLTAPPDRRIADVEERIAIFQNYKELMERHVAETAKIPERMTEASAGVQDIEEELANLTATRDRVNERRQTLAAELDAPARVSLAEPAPIPLVPDFKRRLFVSGGAGLGTLALVLLGISWLEFRIRRVDSPDAVPRELGLRVVGALPATPKPPLIALPGQAAIQEVTWRSRLNENVNAIRALLLRQSQAERLQVIMITSASVGEGKTSLACHLATSLARAGRRTLLLDCDLRSPTAHRVFDLPLEPGLAEVLRGEVPLDEASHPIALGELRMITAGRCDAQALHALGLEPLRETIERLRAQYEFIVIDTPPVLPVSDPLLIGQHVDAALFSILRDVSRVPKVQQARERLAALGVRVLGAVVAGTRLEKYGADYYYAAPAATAAAASSGEV